LSTNSTPREIGGPRLFTRNEVMAIFHVGETTLHWLERTHKLKAVRIGRRVLFDAAEVERLATRGTSLTEREKKEAAKHDPDEAELHAQHTAPTPSPRRRGRPRKAAAQPQPETTATA
jgi:hypothetical protein